MEKTQSIICDTSLVRQVTLEEILQVREDRVCKQQVLISTYHCPVISFTMNIAGPVKISPVIERAFREGLSQLECKLPKEQILFRETYLLPTGCEAMYAVSLEALRLKEICTAIEDASPLGRLFDMDVLDTDHRKLDREEVGGNSRGCIVCGAPGRGCSAGRLHTVSQLQAVTHEIILDYFARKDRESIAELAVQSLIEEVQTTPKPGLVDRRNSGSHKDMELSTFLASADALRPYFRECVKIGQEMAPLSLKETFLRLRQAGIAAEASMYEATGGVNTHKGIVYTMGILCGSLGRLWSVPSPIAGIQEVLKECADMTIEQAALDFEGADRSTAGLRLYHEKGLRGIRGEVAAGLPSVMQIGLPVYQKALKDGLDGNDAGVVTLLHLIAQVEDTNLYHRGGEEGAAYAASRVKKLLNQTPYPSAKQIEALDDGFMEKNLSPGGCADLLAVTYFLWHLQNDRICR